MQVNDELLDILVDVVLQKIEDAVDRTVGDRDITESKYTTLFSDYRKALIDELK